MATWNLALIIIPLRDDFRHARFLEGLRLLMLQHEVEWIDNRKIRGKETELCQGIYLGKLEKLFVILIRMRKGISQGLIRVRFLKQFCSHGCFW